MASEVVDRKTQLATNLEKVRDRIQRAEAACGREQGSVRLLPVTKFHPVADIELLKQLGVSAVGENREQEAREKASQLTDIDFHMIGQVQTKKANSVARWAHSVHSVDSLKLAGSLDRGTELAVDRGDRKAEPLACLVQISLDADATRGGIEIGDTEAISELVSFIEHSRWLKFTGFMLVPPREVAPFEAFSSVGVLKEQWENALGRKLEYSAGMSGDLEDAIACGSTIVRVGTSILGARPLG